MKNTCLYLVLGFVLLSLQTKGVFSGPADNPDAILGTWLTGSQKGRVQIYKQGNRYFGKIVWLQEPDDPKTNQPKTDRNNPDVSKKEQPLLGLVNLRNFSFSGANVWDQGKVYDPENGKEYSCRLTLRGNNTLDVRGYVGISLIGRTDTWQRVK
ncbi:DUF2147 domain-containing protein [Salmonirosea aquatica]|uniref:DUF2147 domain-containing protein n=1 Tax=Salmonirosea aquatica TaxID=2654236 RepID=A0A7C9FQR6_9BACT|nr:DUF2147 domain-containing protein [Cytophagaceae bacterium SJW1-29]